MYKSGQRRNVNYDSSPLSLDLDFLSGNYNSEKNNSSNNNLDFEDENDYIPVQEHYDYNYLFE